MINKVGIVGCGLMGAGIAQAAAQGGFETIMVDIDADLVANGRTRIDKSLAKGIDLGKLDEATRDETLARLSGSTDRNDLADCDLVIEAITEKLGAKHELFTALDKLCKPETILASNTSSLSITELSAATSRRDRFVGLHFFNPVPRMLLVELIRTVDTSDTTFEAAQAFGEAIGKTVIAAGDTPGFVVNRLLVPYLLDAIRALENGVATKEDIDAGMMLGCGYPMGPLALVDFVGLDTTLHVAEILFAEFKESRYAAPPLLRRMVRAGYLGRKSGRGFYEH